MLGSKLFMEGIIKIKGGIAEDQRGQIRFVNDFDMSLVKRFYIIKNSDTDLIRGWRAHRIEQRWFYVVSGAFSVNLVKIDDWSIPDRHLPIVKQIFNASDMQLLHVPPGYGTAFRALEPGSELLVFADHCLEHCSSDDYTWSMEYFINFSI